MKIYVAEPIDDPGVYTGATGDRVLAAIEDVWDGQADVFRPRSYWANLEADTQLRMTRNQRELLDWADAVVAILPPSVTSVGVPIEIFQARTEGIPVLAYRPGVSADSMFLDSLHVSQAGSISQVQAWLVELRLHTGKVPTGNGDLQLAYRVLDGLPTQAQLTRGPFRGDVGLDLATATSVELRAGDSADIPCGVEIALPEGTFGWITGRSSTWAKHKLWVMPGIIDPGWRGELRVLVHYPLSPDYATRQPILHLPVGTRLAQLIVLPNLAESILLHKVGTLPPSDRGDRGFGSSG